MPLSVSEKDAINSSDDCKMSEFKANGETGQSGLAELRKILIQPEEVSEVLPSAIRKSIGKDKRLAEATLPIVEENIRQSAQRNPRVLAEAIFPIIGPAIRKAIAEALSQMVQSLNQTLEHSFSPQGLKWRLEALQTGKPFAEIVLLNTLLYRVEEVFLIHKETGILLQHVSAIPSETQDGDMVSAMLTAIQDFVRDSFKTSEEATLDALKIHDLSVWIEHSPNAILAAVIRGNAPLNLRETFLEAIEEIELNFEDELVNFNGDSSDFGKARPVLEKCLKMQIGKTVEEKKTFFKPFNILIVFLLILFLPVVIFYVRDYWRWSDLVSRLKNEPGFVITEAERGFFKHSISGWHDELAQNPDKILREYGYEAEDVKQNWKTFQDTNPQFVVRRAEKLLDPPPSIKLSFDNGILFADGKVTPEWFSEAKRFALALNGVKDFQMGLTGLKNNIESQKIIFVCSTTDLIENQEKTIENLTKEIESLSKLAELTQKNFVVEVIGNATRIGMPEANNRISLARAEKITEEILSRSEKLRQLRQNFKAVGIGSDSADPDCSVSFKVFLE
jgi:OOP family OmpA-OmpF porin